MTEVYAPVRDNAALDAFARQRVSFPQGLLDAKLTYDLDPLQWGTKLTGSGSCTYLPNEAAARMRVTGVAGDSVVRQTLAYAPYRPGKSQLILATGVINNPTLKYRARIGYFDTANGIFLEMTEDGPAWVIRSSATGTPVDTRVPQAEWSEDNLYDWDWSKALIVVIDAEWLGVGRVRVGVVDSGIPRVAHVFDHAGLYLNAAGNPGVYMSTATLPVRYEATCVWGAATGKSWAEEQASGQTWAQIQTAGTTWAGIAGAAVGHFDVLQICASVASEGAEAQTSGLTHSTGLGANLATVTTRRAILSIRPKATFGGRTNRVQIVPSNLSLYVDGSNDVYWEVIRGGTLGGSPSWASVSDNSAVEVDLAGTTVTGGERLRAGYAAGGGSNVGNVMGDTASDRSVIPLPLTLDIDGANPVALSVVVTSVSGQSAPTGAAIDWTEIR